jgi:hypothetical protein
MLRQLRRVRNIPLVHRVLLSFVDPMTEKEKADTVIEYGRGMPVLVETGTYQGATLAFCVGHFDRLFSIELDDGLYEAACERFAHEASVMLIHGDSSVELNRLAGEIKDPVLWWLDAHYSDDTTAKGPHDPPLEWELRAILERSRPDVILIDDARLMGVVPNYPSIDEIRGVIGDRASTFEVHRDVIRIRLA